MKVEYDQVLHEESEQLPLDIQMSVDRSEKDPDLEEVVANEESSKSPSVVEYKTVADESAKPDLSPY